ncbi:hypothetical protein [Schlesneria paludicola]|uniref:hypothetical protein n=1 Tax=Schlesneria paludicola TaxID=360056 RepID=UPI00029AE380|nr:hypothetical protein [Schlesneria paludicola]
MANEMQGDFGKLDLRTRGRSTHFGVSVFLILLTMVAVSSSTTVVADEATAAASTDVADALQPAAAETGDDVADAAKPEGAAKDETHAKVAEKTESAATEKNVAAEPAAAAGLPGDASKPAAVEKTAGTDKPATPDKPAEPASAELDKVGVAAAMPAKAEKAKENLGQRRQEEIGRNEELSFLQSKVTAQMLELEERMYRLSEALKNLEPENASRLLIGLKYAREELIQLQMKEIQASLTALNFRDAVLEQKQLLAKLQRLEQLLLSPDLDFQLQLERLRLMRELIRRLDAAIKEEEREKGSTEQTVAIEKLLEELRVKKASLRELIARQTTHVNETKKIVGPASDKPADGEIKGTETAPIDEKTRTVAVESLATDQQKTREQTGELETKLAPITEAGTKMEQAVTLLQKNDPVNALVPESEALTSLKSILKTLDEEEKKLEAELAEEKFAMMRKDQANNRKTTEGISEAAVQLGEAGAAARAELIRAAGSMSNAETGFGGRNAMSADGAQGEAIASLKYARELLNAEAEKLLNRLRSEIKKRTLEGLVEMLDGQIAVRQTTERLGPKVKDGARAVVTSVAALANSEAKLIAIGEGLTSLVEETEFGIALPAALRSVTDAMNDVKERLAKVDASEDVIAAEKLIEEDLEALLDAMKQLPSQSDSDGKKGAGGAGRRERELNRIIAELKMVRMLQIRVNRDTKNVDQLRPADLKDLTASLKRRVEGLYDRQSDVHDVTEQIAIERADELQQQ